MVNWEYINKGRRRSRKINLWTYPQGVMSLECLQTLFLEEVLLFFRADICLLGFLAKIRWKLYIEKEPVYGKIGRRN